MVRLPVVSGSFYPGDKESLVNELKKHLGQRRECQTMLGAISPHAGYMYSGSVMGSVFSRVVIPDTVLILSPNHTGRGATYSIWPEGYWSTPLGDVPVDETLVNKLLKSCELLEENEEAHISEHSAEVILPFLQYFNPKVKIVVITIKSFNFLNLQAIGKNIGNILNTIMPSTLVIASSDMTHYESHQSASDKDKSAINKILELDEEGLYNVVKEFDITMCGVSPVVSMIACSMERGATKAELTKYATSGDVSGDYSQVVGYAGIIIS